MTILPAIPLLVLLSAAFPAPRAQEPADAQTLRERVASLDEHIKGLDFRIDQLHEAQRAASPEDHQRAQAKIAELQETRRKLEARRQAVLDQISSLEKKGPAPGSVAEMIGPVSICPGGRSCSPAAADRALGHGDEIRTGKGGAAAIRYKTPNGEVSLRLKENTKFVVDLDGPSGGEMGTLLWGTVKANIKCLIKNQRHGCRVKLSDSVLTIRGTEFELSASENHSELVLSSGKVDFSAAEDRKPTQDGWWKKAPSGGEAAPVQAGRVFRTDASSYSRIALPDGNEAILAPGSELQVDTAKDSTYRLKQGKLHVLRTSKKPVEDTKLRFITATVEARPQNSEFDMSVGAGGRTAFTPYYGSLEINSISGSSPP